MFAHFLIGCSIVNIGKVIGIRNDVVYTETKLNTVPICQINIQKQNSRDMNKIMEIGKLQKWMNRIARTLNSKYSNINKMEELKDM